jgi:hypothetical protein
MVCCLNYSTDPYVKPIVGVADASSKELDGHKENWPKLLPEPKPRHHISVYNWYEGHHRRYMSLRKIANKFAMKWIHGKQLEVKKFYYN